MLKLTGFDTLEALALSTVPRSIKFDKPLTLPPPMTESEALVAIRNIANKNKLVKSFIGMGYYGTVTPGVILRNVLENPGWYTSYTPYQAEIAQGRLESLLNFQTMVSDLCGLDVANASLLDEGTAAAEAMNLCVSAAKKRSRFFVADDCHPQTIAVIQTRASAAGIDVVVGKPTPEALDDSFAGVLLQYPNTYGYAIDFSDLVADAHSKDVMVAVATDLMALSQLKSPGELGADIAVGSAQRFGVPMGYGGPHAGFFATKEVHMRKMPGRIIGVSRDSGGKPAYRMAMQTREQHIRRDKATSNICTAQALLANMAACYGVYHGPDGIKKIASRIHLFASTLAKALNEAGCTVCDGHVFFDTVTVNVGPLGTTASAIVGHALSKGYNIRKVDDCTVSVAFDESATREDLVAILSAFGLTPDVDKLAEDACGFGSLARTSEFMTHPVFNTYRSESQMLRYLYRLQARDLSLTTSMISLGSCTMKLNATSEMVPITWPEFANIHPFAPLDQAEGYGELIQTLHSALCEITGFAAMSTQPNSGAQGEYAGLLAIRDYHLSRGDSHRKVCLIPISAHGTNPASAVMAGMKVVTVKNDANGDVDMDDLRAKAEKHKDNLAALMITYPSTFGVFDTGIKEICDIIHSHGGQVYMDGANMNAQVGLCSPGTIGADVCHLNLHKTFCIPHGGGGPGVGTIGVAKHLAPFLPGHAVVPTGGEGLGVVPKLTGAVSAAPYGSALILPISWMYIHMLGEPGLKRATQMAILNANYMAKRLEDHYKILYLGENGQCAHEFIIDIRPFKSAGVVEEDVAKRLIDYGFHSPTMSWPVGGTLMIEPTESEDRAELDRFVDALISIRGEIQDVIDGRADTENNVLKNAPHTAEVIAGEWDRPYSRDQAAFPAPWLRDQKFWPVVGRLDNVHGDRHLVCSCPPLTDYE